MRVSLFHNEGAGDGVPLSTIYDLLAHAGHELVQVIDASDHVSLRETTPDLLVAAGGDGTVAGAVRLVTGLNIPVAILALGTANNIAESLGVAASVEEAIDRWDAAQRRPFDVGTFRGPAGERQFLEGVGTGLIPAGMRSAEANPIRGVDRDVKLANAVARYRDVLSRLEPTRCTVTIDGHCVTGDFLAIEALNIRSVGPNLIFAPEATPWDGLLSVVMAGEEHREALATYLEACERDDPDAQLSLPTQYARRIEMRGQNQMHIDDEVSAADGAVSIGVESAVVEFLL